MTRETMRFFLSTLVLAGHCELELTGLRQKDSKFRLWLGLSGN